jgi:hypothetical protein
VIRKPIDLPRSASPVKRSTSRRPPPSEVIEIELESSQSTMDQARSQEANVALDDATPTGTTRSQIRTDLSPVSLEADMELSHMSQVYAKSKSGQPQAPHFLALGTRGFDRTQSNQTVSSYGMEDDWLGTDEAQVAAQAAERGRYGDQVVY